MGARYSGGKSDQSEWPRSAEEEGFSKPTMLTGTATGAVGDRGNPPHKMGIPTACSASLGMTKERRGSPQLLTQLRDDL